jgi:hypothetical protein
MMKVQFEALSASLSRAIRPFAGKQETTAISPNQVEPLRFVREGIQSELPPARPQDPEKLETGFSSTPVSVDTVSNLIPVSEKQGCPEGTKSGYLKIPHEVLDTLLPRLGPSEAVVFLRLYRLSVGFNQKICTVGISTLMRVSNLSESGCRRALRRLIQLGLIRQLEVINTRAVKGTTYQINTGIDLKPVSIPDRCQPETGVKLKPNIFDDLKENNHHQRPFPLDDDPAHLGEIRKAYQEITGNVWVISDSETYQVNGIAKVPVSRAVAIMQAVKERNGSRINSFKYFVKEILDSRNPRSGARQKQALLGIIQQVRDLHVGANHYPLADFVFDVKRACARQGVLFDNDLFNTILRKES